MGSKEEFKDFVKKYPLLRDDVNSKTKTWQSIYEEWTLFGEEDESWQKYRKKDEKKDEKKTDLSGVIDYVKKINPDTISKTINNVSKVVSLLQGLGIGGAAKVASKSTGDPLFDKKFDDWY